MCKTPFGRWGRGGSYQTPALVGCIIYGTKLSPALTIHIILIHILQFQSCKLLGILVRVVSLFPLRLSRRLKCQSRGLCRPEIPLYFMNSALCERTAPCASCLDPPLKVYFLTSVSFSGFHLSLSNVTYPISRFRQSLLAFVRFPTLSVELVY